MAEEEVKKPVVKYRVELEKRLEINKSYKERRNRAIALRILSYGLFGQKRFQNLYLSCSLNCFYWALQIGTFLHRRVAGLAMIIKFDQVHVIEYYEQGYAEKKYTKILIKLTKNPTPEDKAEPGYNPCFKSEDIKDELTDVIGKRSDEARRGDRGGDRRGPRRDRRDDRRQKGGDYERRNRDDRRDRNVGRRERDERPPRRDDRDERPPRREERQERPPRREDRDERPARREEKRYGDDRDERRVYRDKDDQNRGERNQRYERGNVKTRGGSSGYQDRGDRGERGGEYRYRRTEPVRRDNDEKREKKEERVQKREDKGEKKVEKKDLEERGERRPPRKNRYSEDSD